MSLPRPIYENLPYIYFIVCGGLLTIGDSLIYVFSASLFYGAACITLVTRSAHRRMDKQHGHKKYPLPELFYEYLPYLYGALAIFLIMITDNPYFQFGSFVLFVIALRNLVFRHNNRTRKPRKL